MRWKRNTSRYGETTAPVTPYQRAAQAWDDRNYWRKSEKLRADYRWAPQTADQLEELIVADDWPAVVPVLVSLIPRFADVTIAKLTRDADHWVGAHRALLRRAAKATA